MLMSDINIEIIASITGLTAQEVKNLSSNTEEKQFCYVYNYLPRSLLQESLLSFQNVTNPLVAKARSNASPKNIYFPKI